MVRVTVRYDGKVLIPEEPVELPTGVSLQILIPDEPVAEDNRPLLALSGLGAEVWEGLDPVEYQRKEREGWR